MSTLDDPEYIASRVTRLETENKRLREALEAIVSARVSGGNAHHGLTEDRALQLVMRSMASEALRAALEGGYPKPDGEQGDAASMEAGEVGG